MIILFIPNCSMIFSMKLFFFLGFAIGSGFFSLPLPASTSNFCSLSPSLRNHASALLTDSPPSSLTNLITFCLATFKSLAIKWMDMKFLEIIFKKASASDVRGLSFFSGEGFFFSSTFSVVVSGVLPRSFPIEFPSAALISPMLCAYQFSKF